LIPTYEDLYNNENVDKAEELIQLQINPGRSAFLEGLFYVKRSLTRESKKILEDKLTLFNILEKSLILVVFVVLILGGAIAVFNTRSIASSINRLTRIVLRLGKGAIPDIQSDQAHDQIGLAVAALKDGLLLKTNFSEAIGEGNLFMPFEPIGEDDKLGKALVKMRNKLVSLADEENVNKWKAEGLSEFGDLLQRHVSIEKLSKEIMVKIVDYFNVQQGVMYVKNIEDTSMEYRMIADYGQNDSGEEWETIQPGVGLVGEAIRAKKSIHLQNVYGNRRKLSSRFVDLEICNILIIPLVSRNRVFGVLELGSLSEFRPEAIWLLEQLAERIGNALANLFSQTKTDIATGQKRG
jgi:hypothetical protein